jgi:hypothetical protein
VLDQLVVRCEMNVKVNRGAGLDDDALGRQHLDVAFDHAIDREPEFNIADVLEFLVVHPDPGAVGVEGAALLGRGRLDLYLRHDCTSIPEGHERPAEQMVNVQPVARELLDPRVPAQWAIFPAPGAYVVGAGRPVAAGPVVDHLHAAQADLPGLVTLGPQFDVDDDHGFHS